MFEPRRLVFAGSAFAAGPWLGAFLHRHVVQWFPYLIAGVAMLALLTFFWAMRLADNPSLQTAALPSVFVVGGIISLAAAALSRFLPRGL